MQYKQRPFETELDWPPSTRQCTAHSMLSRVKLLHLSTERCVALSSVYVAKVCVGLIHRQPSLARPWFTPLTVLFTTWRPADTCKWRFFIIIHVCLENIYFLAHFPWLSSLNTFFKRNLSTVSFQWVYEHFKGSNIIVNQSFPIGYFSLNSLYILAAIKC